MAFRLLLLFIALPLVELAILLWIADQTDWLFTLALVVATGVLGATLARIQGLHCWAEVQRKWHCGQVPGDSLLDGLMILLAGALLITPGVLTDGLGFSLLVPPVRKAIRNRLVRRFQAHMTIGPGGPGPRGPSPDADVIDVDHRPVDDKEP